MQNNKSLKLFRSTAQGALFGLAAMFVLGMTANLFIEIPTSLGPAAVWGWIFSHSAVIAAHVLLGVVLVLTGLTSLMLAIRSRNRIAILASSFGAAFTMMAYFFGTRFVSAGQADLSSLLMALGFLGAVISYGLGVYKLRQ